MRMKMPIMHVNATKYPNCEEPEDSNGIVQITLI